MSKRPKAKALAIACEAADFLPYTDLNPLQGDLKTLEPEDRARLRDSLLNLGFSFPVHAWRDEDGTAWIMDAHQRLDVIRELASEGWEIPPLPVAWVHARNKQEALKKLAAAVSQYGKVTPGGLFEFMKTAKIDLPSLQRSFRFPDIDQKKFQLAYFPEIKTVEFTVKEKAPREEKAPTGDAHHCPKCGYRWDAE